MWLGSHSVSNLFSTEDFFSGARQPERGTDFALASNVEVMRREVRSLPRMLSWLVQRQFYLHLTKNTRSLEHLLFIYTVSTSQRNNRIDVKKIKLFMLGGTFRVIRGTKRNIQIYFVNPYLTENIESCYKDYSVLFQETLAVIVREKRNTLIA
jgi:hypothetical protein